MQPLSLNDAGKRGKIMLLLAWTISAVASIPQVYMHIYNEYKEYKNVDVCRCRLVNHVGMCNHVAAE